MKKMIINDGFNSELVKTAQFESIFEIPCFKSCNYLEIPNEIIQFHKEGNLPQKMNSFIFTNMIFISMISSIIQIITSKSFQRSLVWFLQIVRYIGICLFVCKLQISI